MGRFLLGLLIPNPLVVAELAVVAFLSLGGSHLYNQWIHDPAVRREAFNVYAAKVKVEAEQAQAVELERQKKIGDAALSDLAARLQTAEARADEATKKLEQDISDHEKQSVIDGHSCKLSRGDLEWLRH